MVGLKAKACHYSQLDFYPTNGYSVLSPQLHCHLYTDGTRVLDLPCFPHSRSNSDRCIHAVLSSTFRPHLSLCPSVTGDVVIISPQETSASGKVALVSEAAVCWCL